MNYKSYRAASGIDGKSMIKALHEAYPKYGKPTQSMIDNPQKYGVQLIPNAEKILYERFGAPTPGKPVKRTAPRRKKPCRFTVRLTESQYGEVKQQMEADGYATSQELLEHLLAAYLERKEPCGKEQRNVHL